MIINILPLEPKTVKDKVTFILTYKFPLSIKELKIELKDKQNLNVSYQAIHKVILELLKLGIITQENKKYMLNKEWVKNTYHFSEQTYINYSKIKRYSINILKELKKDGDLLTLDFDSISELDKYFIEIMNHFNEILEPNEKIVMHYKHDWWPLLYSKDFYDIINKNIINKKEPKNRRFYCLCGSNTSLDKWACDFENKIGMNVKYSKDAAQNWDVHIYYDFIIQFYIDTQIISMINKFFNNASSNL